jgi:hypothetical protein
MWGRKYEKEEKGINIVRKRKRKQKAKRLKRIKPTGNLGNRLKGRV